MADVNIQQTPSTGETRSGGSGAVWAIVVVILLLVIGWFVFGGRLTRSTTSTINVNVPGQTDSSAARGAGAGSGASGATKSP
ncbi:MAG TPA: hypothetical protein VH539_00965 [Gemmatimonadaceae bacterium]|jgi:hypothetical protein